VSGFIGTMLIWLFLYLFAGVVATGTAAGLRGDAPDRGQPGFGTLAALGMCTFAFSGFLLSWAGFRHYLSAQLVFLLLLTVLRLRGSAFRKSLVFAPFSREKRRPQYPYRIRIFALFALAYLAFRLLEVGFISASWSLNDWDALAIWGYKAKVLFHESLADAAYFHDLTKSYSQLAHPLMLPLLESQVYMLLGSADDALLPALFPIIYLVLLGGFYEICRGYTGPARALFFTLLLAAVEDIAGFSSTGMADVPLAVFLLLCVGNFLLWKRTDSASRLYAAVALGAAALFTKNEGIPGFLLAVTFFAVPSFVTRREGVTGAEHMALVAKAIALGVVLAGPWLVFRIDLPKTHENLGGRLGIEGLLSGISRLPNILSSFAEHVCHWRRWHILWWLPLIGVILHPRGALSGDRLRLLIYLAGMLAVYGATYLVTPWPVDVALRYSVDRLLTHLAPLVVLFTALLATDLEERIARFRNRNEENENGDVVK
jgi:hypothetical protein